jgi:hypothetical protein
MRDGSRTDREEVGQDDPEAVNAQIKSDIQNLKEKLKMIESGSVEPTGDNNPAPMFINAIQKKSTMKLNKKVTQKKDEEEVLEAASGTDTERAKETVNKSKSMKKIDKKEEQKKITKKYDTVLGEMDEDE